MSNDSSSSPPGPVAPRCKSNVALIASLCLNFVLVGVIATALVHASLMHPGMFGHGHGAGMGMGHGQGQQFLAPGVLMQAAPGEADKIQRIVEAHSDRIATLRLAALGARRNVLHTFEAPALDRNAFDQSLEKVRLADTALESEALKVVSESAATLTSDERKAVAAHGWTHNGPWWRHHGEGRGF